MSPSQKTPSQPVQLAGTFCLEDTSSASSLGWSPSWTSAANTAVTAIEMFLIYIVQLGIQKPNMAGLWATEMCHTWGYELYQQLNYMFSLIIINTDLNSHMWHMATILNRLVSRNALDSLVLQAALLTKPSWGQMLAVHLGRQEFSGLEWRAFLEVQHQPLQFLSSQSIGDSLIYT